MTSLPPEITYGYVTGRFIAAWTDGPDAGRTPDPRPLAGLTIKITPKVQTRRLSGPSPVLVATMPVTCSVDDDGVLIDAEQAPGVWLVTGIYSVTYSHPAVAIPSHDIEVTDAHTEASPLDLVTAGPPGGPVLTPSQYAELTARIDSLVFEAAGVSSVNGATGDVVLDAEDVGALPSSYTPPAQSWTQITEKPATFTPTAHAASHATGGSDPITPASIGASQDGHAHAAAAITDLTETVQDIVGALIKAGAGTTVSYDDAAGSVTITATATGGSTDPEIVRDVIGSAMVAGSGIQVTVNDAGDTITIASTAVLPTRKINAGTGLTGGGDLSADRTLSVSYGTTAGTAAQGNDARLSDARTPTAHTHAYADITDPPTIPGPQTLSLEGNDLTLSDGGGTVTLPSGGGGGGGIGAPAPLPRVGAWLAPHWIMGGADVYPGTNGVSVGGSWFVVPTPCTVDALAFGVQTAETSSSAKVVIYSTDATGRPSTLFLTGGSVSCATTGAKTDTLSTPVALPAGIYWAQILPDSPGGTVRFRGFSSLSDPAVDSNLHLAGGNPAYVLTADCGTFTTPATSIDPSANGTTRNHALVMLRRSA